MPTRFGAFEEAGDIFRSQAGRQAPARLQNLISVRPAQREKNPNPPKDAYVPSAGAAEPEAPDELLRAGRGLPLENIRAG